MLDKTKSYTLLESDLLDRSLQQSLAVVYQNRVLNNPQFSWIFYLNIYLCEHSRGGWKQTVERRSLNIK